MDLPDLTTGQLVAVGGEALVAVAAFLPWITAVQAGQFEVGASATGLDDGLGLVTLLLGLAAARAALVLDWAETGTLAALGAGAVVVLLGLFSFFDLGDAIVPGVGLYLTVAGDGGLGYRDRSDGDPL